MFMQGCLTEGEGSVQSTSLLISAAFYIENKRSYTNEEVNCTEPSPSVRVLCICAVFQNSLTYFATAICYDPKIFMQGSLTEREG
jgi:hypothetical protein